MLLTHHQYRILEGLAACAKVGATTYVEDKNDAYYQSMSGRYQLLAKLADAGSIPFSLQNLTYHFGALHPYEYNSRTIERALRARYGHDFVIERYGVQHTIQDGCWQQINDDAG